MANYHAGRRLEYAVRDFLRKRGYTVIRSAGSKTPVDLVAVGVPGVNYPLLFIQCKKNGRLSLTERYNFISLAERARAMPLLVNGRAYLRLRREQAAEQFTP